MKIEKTKIKSIIKYAVSVSVTVSLVLFAIYHSFGGFSETLSTVISKIVTESETLSADGYIFRDEEVLYSKYNGAVKHLTDNGSYVSVGDDLAVSYSNPTNIDVYARRAELEERKNEAEEELMMLYEEDEALFISCLVRGLSFWTNIFN